jgi:hypothetical protein
MSHEATAREIREAIWQVEYDADHSPIMSDELADKAIDTIIANALRKAEIEALERASEVARSYAQERTEGWPGLDQDEVCQSISGDIALRITALAQTTGGQ